MARWIALALLGLALAACSGAAPAVTLTEADNGKAVQLSQGQMLTVQLAANATTGYGWTLPERPDAGVLQFVKQEYQSPGATDPPRAGAGGVATLQFRATGKGTATVKLVYRQPWQGGSVGQEYNLTVTVT